MKSITIHNLKEISFSDFSIIKITWLNNLHCIIELDGVIFDIGENKRMQYSNNCKLHIEKWDSLEISYYDHLLKTWFSCTKNSILEDICEFILEDNLIIRGFSENNGESKGMWLEYKFKAPKYIYIDNSATENS